jgi:hypothetical protein
VKKISAMWEGCGSRFQRVKKQTISVGREAEI